MTDRFSHITSTPSRKPDVSQRETPTKVKGKPVQRRIGRDAYDTLMKLLSLEDEFPTTPLGTFVANSTKRKLRKEIEDYFAP